MTTQSAMRTLTFTSRIVSPLVATAAFIGLGIYAWRTWMRVRAEAQWESEWDEFQRRQLPPE